MTSRFISFEWVDPLSGISLIGRHSVLTNRGDGSIFRVRKVINILKPLAQKEIGLRKPKLILELHK